MSAEDESRAGRFPHEMRRALFAAVLAAAACKSKPEVKPEPSPPAPVAVVDAQASVVDAAVASVVTSRPDSGTGPWITLVAPLFKEDTGMMPGPKWDFSAPRLPAIDRQAGQVYLPYANRAHLSSTVNFAIQVRSLDGDHLVRTISILTEAEFGEGDKGDLAARQAKYRELEARARARIAKLAAELDALPLEGMTACKVSNPYENQQENPYGCGSTQRLTCGALKMTHKPGGQLAWSSGDAGRTERNFARLRGPKVPGPQVYDDDGGLIDTSIPTNDCFGYAYVDARAEWLVGSVDYFCQGGGDWCSTDEAEVVLPLR
jgi:hypothetical protein